MDNMAQCPPLSLYTAVFTPSGMQSNTIQQPIDKCTPASLLRDEGKNDINYSPLYLFSFTFLLKYTTICNLPG